MRVSRRHLQRSLYISQRLVVVLIGELRVELLLNGFVASDGGSVPRPLAKRGINSGDVNLEGRTVKFFFIIVFPEAGRIFQFLILFLEILGVERYSRTIVPQARLTPGAAVLPLVRPAGAFVYRTDGALGTHSTDALDVLRILRCYWSVRRVVPHDTVVHLI